MSRFITDKSNIVNDIRNLQISPCGNMRKKHRMMRKLICLESSKYSRIWQERSHKAIYYESDKIYFNNYRKCLSSFGRSGIPELLYELPTCPLTEKTEDALVCEFNTDKVSTETEVYRSHMITLTRDGYIFLRDLETGRIMRKVFLSNKFKFRHLSWNTVGESFSVKAKNHSFLQDRTVPSVIIIMFEVFPLRLHSQIALTKKVFKKSISAASVMHGLLIVMHSGNLIRLFSYDRIIEKHTTNMVTLDNLPLEGIPITVTLEEMPPILFEVKCNEHKLWLGGIPLHYLYQPNRQDVYTICRLKTEAVIENGSIPVSLDAFETDNLSFMNNDSNRIVHITVSSARILKITTTDQNQSKIEELFRVLPHDSKPFSPIDTSTDTEEYGRTWVISSSGRIIKRRISPDQLGSDSNRIYSLDYDGDVELLVVTSLVEGKATGGKDAFICFHDYDTGHKVKTVELEEEWDDTYEHTIILDFDTLIHIYKECAEYVCIIYRLDRSIPDETPRKHPKR